MLSYVIPVEEKSSSVVSKSHLQLELDINREVGLPPRAGGYKRNGLTKKQEEMAPTAIHNFINIERQANGNGGLANGKPKTKGIIVNGCSRPAISTESSASSLSSKASEGANQGGGGGGACGVTTPTVPEKLKPKLVQNGAAKTTSLKRVSFGSSKGSMVETLIYETPLQEESEVITPAIHVSHSFPAEGDSGTDSKKVRVSFFESERPLVVNSPEVVDVPFDVLDGTHMMSSTGINAVQTPQYQRQASTDSGWDNPFRPDGDLSREADEIVGLIKEGKPISSLNGAPKGGIDERDVVLQQTKSQLSAASPKKGFNGTTGTATAGGGGGGGGGVGVGKGEKAGVVEVQRTVVSPSGGGDVEPVVIKKKPKCKCCVIQ